MAGLGGGMTNWREYSDRALWASLSRCVRAIASIAFLIGVGALLVATYGHRQSLALSSNSGNNKSQYPVADTLPLFSPVVFLGEGSDHNIVLSGYGFGNAPQGVPCRNCDIPFFRIGDPTCGKFHPGACEAGYTGDGFTLNYNSWNDHRIQISAYTVARPGDAVELGVWTSQEQSGPLASVWGGNIPPVKPGSPRIDSVLFSGNGQNLGIIINGSGFGKTPLGIPCRSCDTAYLRFGDYAYHSFNVGSSVRFRACFSYRGAADSITCNYKSWSDTQIVLSGFAGAYGQDDLVVNNGDAVSIDIWSTTGNGELATAWGGRVP
jgi:hypothetical protein